MRPRHLLVIAVLSLTAGVLAAFADGADGQRRTSPTVPPAPPARPVPAPAPAPAVPLRPIPCDEPTPPAAAPVPQGLLDAFGVLRRERTDKDTLPANALTALRRRGLEPFDPAAARLLRTTPDGGRAWVVPVRDVATGPFVPICIPKAARPLPRGLRRKAAPRPGLAVVALGGAPAGGGGAADDLVRGRAPVTVDPCGGPNRDMLAVSGIVPDGVPAAFLTSPDGTAVRADVQDNGYAFVVPRPKDGVARYVVWTGGDGTPHVQPVPVWPLRITARCVRLPRELPMVSPLATGPCDLIPALPVPAPAPRGVPGARLVPPPPAPRPCISTGVAIAPAIPPRAGLVPARPRRPAPAPAPAPAPVTPKHP